MTVVDLTKPERKKSGRYYVSCKDQCVKVKSHVWAMYQVPVE